MEIETDCTFQICRDERRDLNAMNADKMTIEILADGTIKTTTDKISAPNHASADAFLRDVAQLTGNQTTKTKRSHSHAQHTHGQTETEGH